MMFPKPVRKPKKKRGIRKVSQRHMTTKLDDLVRQIFRKKWQPVCYICGAEGEWGKDGIQVGHYISRKVFNLRWDFHNLYPNCPTCNSLHEYYAEPFRKAILNKEGQARLDYLERKFRDHIRVKDLKKLREKQELYEQLTLVLSS